MPVSNLQQLLEHELRDVYSAEEQIVQALPTMIAAATSEDLKTALTDHLEVTKEQLQRLDSVNEHIAFRAKQRKCEGIAGIISEAEKGLKEIDDADTRDAAIIASAQKVEHYEIASYGSAAEFARQLELDEVVDLLEDTLEEEKDADENLTGLAQGGFLSEGINEKAADDADVT